VIHHAASNTYQFSGAMSPPLNLKLLLSKQAGCNEQGINFPLQTRDL
jgi:hypothetical protein